mmetsp:Transcript_7518/g.16590  ORF Transcript_7518/g.16590 Transcript_7518/m.16590 type:complete len:318 (-) Transcript_7518:273-1226(-)
MRRSVEACLRRGAHCRAVVLLVVAHRVELQVARVQDGRKQLAHFMLLATAELEESHRVGRVRPLPRVVNAWHLERCGRAEVAELVERQEAQLLLLFGCAAAAHLVEGVVRALPLEVLDDAGLLEQVRGDARGSDETTRVEMNLDPLAEPRGVAVAQCLRVAECLEQRVGLHDALLHKLGGLDRPAAAQVGVLLHGCVRPCDDVAEARLDGFCLPRPRLARDEDGLLLLLVQHPSVRRLGDHIHVRRQLLQCLRVGFLASTHRLLSVDGDLLERVDRDEYRPRCAVDVVARVAHAQVVQQRRLSEVGELDHVVRALQC